jgi:hypothetical protein
VTELRGIVTAIPGDTFHIALRDGTDIWIKPTPAELGIGLEIGTKVRIYGDWSCPIGDDEMRLFSAREIQKLGTA